VNGVGGEKGKPESGGKVKKEVERSSSNVENGLEKYLVKEPGV